MIKMQMGEDYGVYFLGGKIKSAEVLVEGSHIFNRQQVPG
jgi:hypothetical protein